MLTLAGVSAGAAVLATFAYRLFTYWLPLPVGLVAFGWHARRYREVEAATVQIALDHPFRMTTGLPVGGHDPQMATRRSDADELTIYGAVGLVLLASLLFWPRFVMLGFLIFDREIGRAFDSWAIPFAGFFLLPWTTLAYAWMWTTGTNEVRGFEWFLLILAFVVDLGSLAGGQRGRSS